MLFRQLKVTDYEVYIFKRKRIDYITRDHSVAGQLVASGLLKEKYICTSPDRNRLLRVVGIEGEPPFTGIDLKTDILPGDCILICTDGFWEYISERRMIAALRRAKNASDWLAAMEKQIEKKAVSGAADNRSAEHPRPPWRRSISLIACSRSTRFTPPSCQNSDRKSDIPLSMRVARMAS